MLVIVHSTPKEPIAVHVLGELCRTPFLPSSKQPQGSRISTKEAQRALLSSSGSHFYVWDLGLYVSWYTVHMAVLGRCSFLPPNGVRKLKHKLTTHSKHFQMNVGPAYSVFFASLIVPQVRYKERACKKLLLRSLA